MRVIRNNRVYKILLPIVLLIALGSYLYNFLIQPDEFLPDVQIGGVDVGGYDRAQAVTALNQTLDKMKSIPVFFYKDDYELQVQLGDLIVPFNIDSIVESAWQDEQKRTWYNRAASLNPGHKVEYPVNLDYRSQKATELLNDWIKKWRIKPINASLEIDSKQGLIVTPEKAGTEVSETLTFRSLPVTLIDSGEIRLPIVVEKQEPKVTSALLQDMIELAVYSTHYNTGDANRSFNLGLATASINESFVKPGEVFSFNNIVGPRSVERGYREAKIIVGNKFESGLGGGVCQVSTTLYNAVLLTGLKITERHNHNLSVSYVSLGRDAAVNYGSQDFQFENNLEAPVYIRSNAKGGNLTITVYGNKQYKQNIKITHVVDRVIPFETITQRDTSLQPGQKKVIQDGKSGYIAKAFRSFYETNGILIKTEQLSRNVYQSVDQIIVAGPEVVPPVVPAEPLPENKDHEENKDLEENKDPEAINKPG
ncbi:MAG: VanW family protein [Desulfitobacteriaceae bacterium]|nr:VanW family protein [Desulfitobacteriaceae bacterium]